MITVVFFLWHDPQSQWRSEYTYDFDYVHRAMQMVDEHLTVSHEFVLVTDYYMPRFHDVDNFRIIPIDKNLYIPGKRYQKLMIFKPDAEELFGKRILMLDLDNVILNNIDDLVSRTEDIVLWKNPTNHKNTKYNTSVVLLKAGSRPFVWTEFNIRHVPTIIRRERLSGTDQAWVSRILDGEATWTKDDGICSFTYDFIKPEINIGSDVKILSFNGRISPMSKVVKEKYPYIYNYYARLI